MKKLPCPHPACGGYAQAPGGGPVVIGRLSSSPLSYPCRGCRRIYKLTAQEWARLPELPDQEALAFLSAEERLRGAQPLALDTRVASSMISPTAGRLVT